MSINIQMYMPKRCGGIFEDKILLSTEEGLRFPNPKVTRSR
jgi:hypothetical protein